MSFGHLCVLFCISSLVRYLLRSLTHFVIGLFVFLMLSFKSCLYILDNSQLSDVSFGNIFSQSMAYLLILFPFYFIFFIILSLRHLHVEHIIYYSTTTPNSTVYLLSDCCEPGKYSEGGVLVHNPQPNLRRLEEVNRSETSTICNAFSSKIVCFYAWYIIPVSIKARSK